jgi:hypothetical protein
MEALLSVKRVQILSSWHGITFLKAWISITTTVKTSNLTLINLFSKVSWEFLLSNEFELPLSSSRHFRWLCSLIMTYSLSLLVLNALDQFLRLGSVEELWFPDVSVNVAAVIFLVVIGGVGAYIDRQWAACRRSVTSHTPPDAAQSV